MRKVLLAFGVMGLLFGAAGTAGADEARHRIRLDRSMFDQLGPTVDTAQLCGPAGARSVENRRSGGDAVVTFLSLGFYTPTHVNVVCNTPAPESPPLSLR